MFTLFMNFIHVYEFITNQALLTEGFFSSELFNL